MQFKCDCDFCVCVYSNRIIMQFIENSNFLYDGLRISSRLACCLLVRLSFKKSDKLQVELRGETNAGTDSDHCLVIFRTDSEKMSSSLNLFDFEKNLYFCTKLQ